MGLPSEARSQPRRQSGGLFAWGRSLGPVVLGVALAAAVQATVPGLVGPYYARIVMDVGIAMMLAVSLNIVNGMTGQFSIGHAGFMTIGGYTAGMVTYYGSLLLWGSTARHGGLFGPGEWLFVLGCLTGGLAAAAAGYAVGLPSLRLRGDYLAIVTLGFGEILRVVLQQTNPLLETPEALQAAGVAQWMPPPVGGAVGFDGLPKYTSLFWVYAALGLTVLAAFRLKYSALGRAMLSVREDELATQAMGVNASRTKVLAFVFSALLAGIAGGLFAHESGLILTPKDAGFQKSFDYVMMAVLGGRGSITGVMLAAVALTALPELLRDFEQYRQIVFAMLLVGMMIVRPQGLLGLDEVWEPWVRKRRRVLAQETP